MITYPYWKINLVKESPGLSELILSQYNTEYPCHDEWTVYECENVLFANSAKVPSDILAKSNFLWPLMD